MRWFLLTMVLLLLGCAVVVLAVRGRAPDRSSRSPFLDDIPLRHLQATPLDPDARGIPVLCYHYFRGSPGVLRWARVTLNVLFSLPLLDETEEWTLPASSFEDQLAYLKREGFRSLTLAELETILRGEAEIPERAVVLTIDDGDRSVYEHAFPLLRKYGMNASLFLVTGRIGESEWHHLSLCTWDEIREMERSGHMEIHSHTHDLHFKVPVAGKMVPAFEAVMVGSAVWAVRRNMTGLERSRPGGGTGGDRPGERAGAWEHHTGAAALLEDLITSRRIIRAETGAESAYLAWPFGYGNPQADSLAQVAGFRSVLTLRPGPNTQDDLPDGIRRYAVTAWTTMRVFRAMVGGDAPDGPRPEEDRGAGGLAARGTKH